MLRFDKTPAYTFATEHLNIGNTILTPLSTECLSALRTLLEHDGALAALSEPGPAAYRKAFNAGKAEPQTEWVMGHQACLRDPRLRGLPPTTYVKSDEFLRDSLSFGYTRDYFRHERVSVYDAVEVPSGDEEDAITIARGGSTAFLLTRIWHWHANKQIPKEASTIWRTKLHLAVYVTAGKTRPRHISNSDVVTLTDFIEDWRIDCAAPAECTYLGVRHPLSLMIPHLRRAHIPSCPGRLDGRALRNQPTLHGVPISRMHVADNRCCWNALSRQLHWGRHRDVRQNQAALS